MARERRVSWDEVTLRARRLLEQHGPGLRYWGIPRGGNYVAAVLAGLGATVTTDAGSADLAVDDILDSGRTAERIRGLHGIDTVALFDKVAEGFEEWLVFPWEGELELDAHDTVTRLIQQIGDDPSRDGLRGTPERVVRGWAEQFSGYRQRVEDGAAAAGAPPGSWRDRSDRRAWLSCGAWRFGPRVRDICSPSAARWTSRTQWMGAGLELPSSRVWWRRTRDGSRLSSG